MRHLGLLVVLSMACAAADQPPASSTEGDLSAPAQGPITITGTVTDEGVECPAVRADDKKLYTIAGGDRNVLRAGARVKITGEIAEISFCQQGSTISATKIEVLP